MLTALGIVFAVCAFGGAVAWLIWVCLADTPAPRERPRKVRDVDPERFGD